MHRTIGYISKRFTQIRPGEERKVLLTFLYFFLVITAYDVIKPVSRSLMLDDLGHRMIPYADLYCVFLMGPIVALFARLVDRVSKPRLVSLSFGAVIAVTILFWRLVGLGHPWIAWLFYIWVAIFSVLIVTLFWLVANDLYRPREAKRLFGFIGSGGLLGGIAGSSIAWAGSRVVGAENLLLLAAGFLVACWWVVGRLWRYAPDPALTETETLASPPRDTPRSSLREVVGMIFKSRYLLLLVAIVCLNKIIAKFVYYQFNPFIEYTFADLDAKTAFTALFNGWINIAALVVQFFFTSWILRRLGLLWALLILPFGVLAGTGALILVPIFWMAAGTELYDRSLNYSLNNTAKEVLYLPIDRSIRYKVKPFIDMVVYRFGGGIAAIVGIVLLDQLQMPAWYLSVFTIPLLVWWLIAALGVRREYTMRIRTLLQARASARSASEFDTSATEVEPKEPVSMGSLTMVRSPQRKLSLVAQLVDGHLASSHAKELLTRLERRELSATQTSRLQVKAAFEVEQLKQTIQHQLVPLSLRRQAVRLLGRMKDQDALDYLSGMLMVEREATLTHEATREMVKIHIANLSLQLPVGQIRRQVSREVANYQRIAEVGKVYRQQHPGPLAADDPVKALLRVLMEESTEEIFRLLMLIYGPQDVHLVYEQMRVEDTHVRADAIELLDNLVDRPMRSTIFPILDEDRFLSSLDGDGEFERTKEPTEAYRIFQQGIWDANSWLSVTTLCAVGRLRLTTMREELEKASRHTEPLVSSAAKVALQFAAFA